MANLQSSGKPAGRPNTLQKESCKPADFRQILQFTCAVHLPALTFIYYFKIKHTCSFKSFYVLSTFNSLHETPTELLLESNSLING